MNGEVRRNSFSCPEHLLELLGEEFIQPIREETRFKLNRSNLIQTLFELALEAKENFNAEQVFDRASFKVALREALTDGLTTGAPERLVGRKQTVGGVKNKVADLVG